MSRHTESNPWRAMISATTELGMLSQQFRTGLPDLANSRRFFIFGDYIAAH
jgi:hypothetical protein